MTTRKYVLIRMEKEKNNIFMVVKMQFLWYNKVVKMQEVITCYSEKHIKT